MQIRTLTLSVAAVAAITSAGLLVPARRHHAPALTPAVQAASQALPPLALVVPPADPAAPLDIAESTVLAERKRIMGRRHSLEMVARVATEDHPIVLRALEMPSIQEDLRALAAGAGMGLPDYKRYFAGKQEADLMLESGGNPDARSGSNAVGVAQYLAGTGRACGLRVNESAARPYSREIPGIETKLAWLAAQAADWGKPAPGWAQPERANAPLLWHRDQWIAMWRTRWRRLELARRQVDERYDPAKAIPVQTRYLVKLSRRYGSFAWALQAYHGGEGGVAKEMALFHLAGPVTYEDLYRHATPTEQSDAFYYLYGRSDDHRYYWWKVLMAERAIGLYRADPAEFTRQWQALKPGLRMEVAWYGDPQPLSFPDVPALRRGAATGTLVGLPANLAGRGIQLGDIAPFDPQRRADYKFLRPEAMGALLRIAAVYRGSGGREPLHVLSLVQTGEGAAFWRSLHPLPRPKLPPGEPFVEDPDFHPTGLVFDLARPAGEWDRRVLEYALGTLYDRLRISWQVEEDGRHRQYHVVPNPVYRAELAAVAHPGRTLTAKR